MNSIVAAIMYLYCQSCARVPLYLQGRELHAGPARVGQVLRDDLSGRQAVARAVEFMVVRVEVVSNVCQRVCVAAGRQPQGVAHLVHLIGAFHERCGVAARARRKQRAIPDFPPFGRPDVAGDLVEANPRQLARPHLAAHDLIKPHAKEHGVDDPKDHEDEDENRHHHLGQGEGPRPAVAPGDAGSRFEMAGNSHHSGAK